MRPIEKQLIDVLFSCSDKYYGEDAISEAWGDFTLWDEEPMDSEENPDVFTLFFPWFLYQWTPDNFQLDKSDRYPEQPIALTYLHKNTHKLSKLQKRFIHATCEQPYSFMVVTEVDKGKSLFVKDLFVNRQYLINDQTASSTITTGNIIFGQILTLDDTSILLGYGSILIPASYYGHLLDVREYFEQEYGKIDLQFLHDYDTELREAYFDLKETILNPPKPILTSTDDELLQPTKLSYQLNCSVDEAFHALKTLAHNWSEQELLSDEDIVFDSQNQIQNISFPWLKKGNRKHKNWENTVLGHIRISDKQLTIDVNSNERAEQIKRKINRRLGKQAKFKHAVIESIEKMMAQIDQQPAGHANPALEDFQQTPEVQTMLKEMAEKHWQEWIDTPLPVLKGKTPRQAAKTKIFAKHGIIKITNAYNRIKVRNLPGSIQSA